MRQLIITLTLPFLLNAQVHYAGSVHPYNLYRISDGSEISLPFRLANLELGYTRDNIDFKLNSALEYRWSTGEYEFDLREAYLVWYPDFGEVRLGKQIFVWGAADGNNPTDNLSAYDYYYLFLPGTDRKIGSLSTAVNLYLDNWQIEAVLITEHKKNRFPFGEEDFPVAPPFQPPDEQFVDMEKPLEYGVRVQTTLQGGDASLSYFKGHDRAFTLVGIAPWKSRIPDQLKFGYLESEIIGADFVFFIGDLTLRAEGAYFRSSNGYSESTFLKLEAEAEYVQYVLQLEYTTPSDIQLTGQYIGNSVRKAEGETFDMNAYLPIQLNKDNFHPGMGTPFALFSDQSVILSARGNLMDDRLELRGNALMDLEETGYMLGVGVDYSPIENWSLEFSVSKFIGDGDPDSDNVFNTLEDFSHIIIGLKYSF